MADPAAPSLKERLAGDLRTAMKAREKTRLGALRLLTAAVKNREVELGHGLSDDEFIEVATREVKRRREAIDAYTRAGRADRAETEAEEQRAVEVYLPAALSEEEVSALIERAIAASGASGPRDVGTVMGLVMREAKGRADGRAVQEMVRARLGGPG